MSVIISGSETYYQQL